MNKNILTVVGITILFLGVVVQPGIQAELSKEGVVFISEICGIQGTSLQKVTLPNEESEALNNFLSNIKNKLDNVETREETIDFINGALIELDKFGLIGGLSVEELQRIIKVDVYRKKFNDILNFKNKELQEENNIIENYFCLVIGHTDSTYFNTLVRYAIEFSIDLFRGLYFLGLILSLFFKGPIMNFICNKLIYLHGLGYTHFFNYDHYIHSNKQPFVVGSKIVYGYADGWVFSIGANGIKRINGSIHGLFGFDGGSIGIKGFTGLKIVTENDIGKPPTCFYIGTALHLKIENYEYNL